MQPWQISLMPMIGLLIFLILAAAWISKTNPVNQKHF
jgi:hypothetical protein